MSDHHIDTMEGFDYSKAAERVLKRRGVFIADAPPINHKPGNDLMSDVYYPFPNYPDNRFADAYEQNNQIKDPTTEDENTDGNFPIYDGEDLCDELDMLQEELDEFRNIRNPVITYLADAGKTLMEGTAYPYTGLTLQVKEKKAFDVTYLKPKNDGSGRKVEVHTKEIITGHPMSIATFDGYNYHIFRGLCVDILKTNYNPVSIRTSIKSKPWGGDFSKYATTTSSNDALHRDVMQRNVRIVLDVSQPMKAGMESIPVNQIIDIQEYDHLYDFTIYEGDLRILWKDWFQTKDPVDEKWCTYVPIGDYPPQSLLHPVIEHQKPR